MNLFEVLASVALLGVMALLLAKWQLKTEPAAKQNLQQTVQLIEQKNQQAGFGLLEMLVVILLSSIVASVLVAFIGMHHRLDRRVQQKIELQEKLRFSDHFLRGAVQTAGFKACQSSKKTAIQIFHGKKPSFVSATVYSDVLLVKRMLPMTALVLNVDNKKIEASLQPRFKKGDHLIIVDCQASQLVQVEKASFSHFQLISLNKNLLHHYQRGAEIGEEEGLAFFVGKTSRKEGGKPLYALYQERNGRKKQELIAGVTEFSVRKLGNRVFIQLKIDGFSQQLIISSREPV